MPLPAPIGVLASSQARANDLIRELRLTDARALPAVPASIDGMRLHAIIIDESALPVSDQLTHTLHCNLLKTLGHAGIYELRRRQ